MFKNLLDREKPRIYLGVLAVAPRSDIKRYIDEWAMFKGDDLDESLRNNLREIFSLPLALEVEIPKDNDLVLDVVVPKFQSGDAWDLSLGDLGMPLMWRPKVTISSRLYYLKTAKTKATFSVTEKMKIGEYINRVFSWRGFFRWKPMFDSKDMEYLLCRACYKLLLKMQDEIKRA